VRTQVGIVGAGPAGLLLSHLLHLQGIESVVLEARDRSYVERRVRAGVLEHGTVETLREAGVSKRMDADGLEHDGVILRFDGLSHRVAFRELTGRHIVVYGQQEVVKDLIAARLEVSGDLRFGVAGVRLHDLDTSRPRIDFEHDGEARSLWCDFVVGADGFHGVSRDYLVGATTYERSYPFAWLGILAEAPPSSPELIYARHSAGFALHSMRSPAITRMYLQVRPDEDLADWSDGRIWAELHERLADSAGFALAEGSLLEKAITPMRSFVSDSMQEGRLFIAGDAAHIVPPTGAKGMNLAVADVRLLSRAFGGYYGDHRTDLLDAYTEVALQRVWRATHFSWWMTTMLHVSPDADEFSDQLARAQLRYVATSSPMAASLAENYTGLPYTEGWSYR
jgi:p-hydroxybenzoate 3-monooxygenase